MNNFNKQNLPRLTGSNRLTTPEEPPLCEAQEEDGGLPTASMCPTVSGKFTNELFGNTKEEAPLTDQTVQLEGELGVIRNDKGSVTYGNLTLPKWKCEETQLVQQASKCLWREAETVRTP